MSAGADLKGKVVVVTGGNAGIGRGIAEAVSKAGADVAIWGRRDDSNQAAAESVRALGVRAAAVQCDVSQEQSVIAAMEQTLESLGKVDVMFANAGATQGVGTSFVDLSLETWRESMAINLDGSFLCLREAARHLIERGEGGSLVLVSSISAIHGTPENIAYSAAKTGVLGLTRSLAVELARHRIRVNAFLPGWTRTEMTEQGYAHEGFRELIKGRIPLRRWADAAEMGEAVVFLADPRHSYHTGDRLVIDGGYTIA